MLRWLLATPDRIFDRLGMRKAELAVAVELSAQTAPWVTKTYVRQMELADMPGGSEKTKYGHRPGAQWLYELPKRGDQNAVRLIPFVDMFPDSWPQLVGAIQCMATKTERLVRQEALPPSYAALVRELAFAAKVYASRETNFRKRNNMSKELSDLMEEVAGSGCPIDISVADGAFVARDAQKVDAEFRVAIRTPHTRALEKKYLPYRDIATQVAAYYQSSLDKKWPIARVNMSLLLSRTGSNIYEAIEGESSDLVTVCYVNSLEDITRYQIIPIYEKLFGPVSRQKRGGTCRCGPGDTGWA